MSDLIIYLLIHAAGSILTMLMIKHMHMKKQVSVRSAFWSLIVGPASGVIAVLYFMIEGVEAFIKSDVWNKKLF